MTPEEKAKLYAAIGYDEEDVDPNLPKQVIQCCSQSFIVIYQKNFVVKINCV